MGFFSDLLKLGGTVASFIPGGQIIGAGASALGGMMDAGAAQRAAGRNSAATNAAYHEQMAPNNELIQTLLPLLKSGVGTIGGPAYGDAWSETPWDPRNQEVSVNQYGQDLSRDLEDYTAQARMDAQGRGVAQSNDPAAAIAARQAARDKSLFAANLRVRGADQRFAESKAREDAQMQRLLSLFPIYGNMVGQNMGGIGGAAQVGIQQQQMAQGQADSLTNAIGQMVGAVAKGGQLPGKAGTPSAGDNRTGTNQSGNNPMGTIPMAPSVIPFNPNASPVPTPGGTTGGRNLLGGVIGGGASRQRKEARY